MKNVEIRKVIQTIALLRSMIDGKKEHSNHSNDNVKEALSIMEMEEALNHQNIDLLTRAEDHILNLRRQNELMSARLDMFDAMTQLLHTKPSTQNHCGMSPDLVYEIRKSIEVNTNDKYLKKP